MTWNATLLAVHICALCGAAFLYRSAPCWMQKVVVGLLIATMVVFSASFVLALCDVWWNVLLKRTGYAIEHIAILLYVFRLIYQDHLQWTSSAHSHKS